MIAADMKTLLQDIMRREGRSLLHYVSDAFPWANANERAALARLLAMIAEEQRAGAAFSQFLLRQHLSSPHGGPYPMDFANVNYVSIDYLLPRLVENQRGVVARLDQDVLALYDPDAREHARKLLDVKRRHLEEMEKLASECKASAA